jgi:ABC-2 type transport system permease protein
LSTLRIVIAFVRRDWAVSRSYRLPFVLELVSMVATLALFFYVGHLIGPSPSKGLPHGYFAFAAVGLAFIRLLQVGLVSFTSRVRDEQLTGTFETLMATSTPPSVVILAEATYDQLRAVVGGLVMMVLAVTIFGLTLDTGVASLLVCAVAVAATLILFSALGVGVAAFTVVFKQTGAVVGLLVVGLAFLAGAYFPIDVLPAPLRAIADVLPFSWSLDVLRSGLLRDSADVERLAGLCGVAAVSIPVALLIFRAALRSARRSGTLAHY